MKSILKFIYRTFAGIAMKWWCFWSNIRFKRCAKEVEIYPEDIVHHPDDVRNLSLKLYSKFKYTEDGPDQLWDAIVPPPQNYLNYKEGGVEDDCDGFHSTLYHCVKKSGFDKCYLLAVTGPRGGHCLLIFNMDERWCTEDYQSLYQNISGRSLEDTISSYRKQYENKYKEEIWFESLIEYDYIEHKFKTVNPCDLN